MSERLRHLEAAEQYLTGGADPNGIVNAAEGTPFWDNVNDELYYNTDGVTAWQIIGGGGGGPALPHNILSVTHGDTVANAVTRGSLIYGNATPAWDELNLGGITGSVLTRNATDALWSSYGLAGTAGQTYTFPGASNNIPGGSGVANQVTYWSGVDTLTGAATFTYNPAASPNLLLQPANAARIGMVIRNAVAQTAGALEIQNSALVVTLLATGFDASPAFQINKEDLSDVFTVDTLNSTVGVRTPAPVGVFDSNGVPNLLGYMRFTQAAGINYIESGLIRAAGSWAPLYFTPYSTAVGSKVSIDANGLVGINTDTPARLLHVNVADAATATITYATRRSHATSGAATSLFGIGHEDELEDGAGNMQVASETATLWAIATSGVESPLYRVSTYPTGSIGPGYSGQWSYPALTGATRRMIPNGAGDAIRGMAGKAVVYADTGADIYTTDFSLQPSTNVEVYNDGVDIVQLQMDANGSITAQRTAGADTFKITVWGTWLYGT